MSVDINGWVEVSFVAGHWSGVLHISGLVDRNYGMFGSLFDVKNADKFATPFARRGLPPDISLATDEELQDRIVVAPTWITEEELKTINWDELGAVEAGTQIVDWDKLGTEPEYEYAPPLPNPTDQGVLLLRRKRQDTNDREWETYYMTTSGYRAPNGVWISHGKPGTVYLEVRRSRREVLSKNWQVLLQLMDVLGKAYGDDRVRVVAWFDSE